MSLRRRIWLAMAGVVLLGAALSLRFLIDDLRPRHLATMEESLVDQAHILAHIAGEKWDQSAELARLFEPSEQLATAATIYEVTKISYDLDILVTDKQGIVRFGPLAGSDHSQWNNIIRTQRGEYGARSTRTDPDDPGSSVLHVSAPIRRHNTLVGVLTVAKRQGSIDPFLATTRRSMIIALAYVGVGMVVLAGLLTVWTTWPLRRLLHYVNNTDINVKQTLPYLGPSDVRAVGEAFAAMHTRLQGKAYIERYVSALSHELKSPIAAIRGAAELLQEDLEANDRQRFIANILRDSKRCAVLLEQLVRLAAIERIGQLADPQPCDLAIICRQQLALQMPEAVSIQLEQALPCSGDADLLQLAIANILSNAIQFSPPHTAISVSAIISAQQVGIEIRDAGPGIPPWALSKVRDRFFSLPRPNGHKSSGLGLALVVEICDLHHGTLEIVNNEGPGTTVRLLLPRFS